jgi:hypothetical protein
MISVELLERLLPFDDQFYATGCAQRNITFDGAGIAHFADVGCALGISPNALVDVKYLALRYAAANPVEAIRTYLARPRDIVTHPLFDPAYYAAQVQLGNEAPLMHFVRTGGMFGDPHEFFSREHYFRVSPDVDGRGINPLSHFIVYGAREGRDPHPLFSTAWYRARYLRREESKNPLVHWLRDGGRTTNPHPLFDVDYYLAQSPELRESVQNPLSHFLTVGWREGRSPHKHFSVAYYLQENKDVREAGINPLIHFLRFGADEGRNPSSLFDTNYYFDVHKDVRAIGSNPLLHYLETGEKEGREIRAPRSAPEPVPVVR